MKNSSLFTQVVIGNLFSYKKSYDYFFEAYGKHMEIKISLIDLQYLEFKGLNLKLKEMFSFFFFF